MIYMVYAMHTRWLLHYITIPKLNLFWIHRYLLSKSETTNCKNLSNKTKQVADQTNHNTKQIFTNVPLSPWDNQNISKTRL